jgi:hypothetical protein
LGEERSYAVLDLGTASDANLRAYGRFARWVQFADLLRETTASRTQTAAAGQLPTDLPPDRFYDLVFGWDVLDRLRTDDRAQLANWLAEITRPSARLHFIVRGEHGIAVPLRFTLLDTDRIRFEPTSTWPLPGPRLLPAEVAKLLAPFRVAHAFSLRSGLREYVAVRPL